MINNQKISVIIPCRNEEKSIASMIKNMPFVVDEVVVVDNKSTDKTEEVARKAGAVVVRENRIDKKGIGYGYAHVAGIKAASGDVLVTLDGDGTYPMEQIEEAVEYLNKNSLDFLTCSRFPLKNDDAISWFRRLGVWILNTQVKILYGYKMQDILSGMWVVRKKVASKLNLKEGGWDLSPEIKLNALMSKEIKFDQYHINHEPRDNGASKQKLWETGFGHLNYILTRRIKEMISRLDLASYARYVGMFGAVGIIIKYFSGRK